jgi:hypothetical protein
LGLPLFSPVLKERKSMARRSGNPNHPKNGSAIKVHPIRSIEHIESIKTALKS